MSDLTRATEKLKPITIKEMVRLYPSLFVASAQFLLIEPNLEAALK